DDDSEGDNESEEFLYGVQENYPATDLYRHPQLDADIEAVKEIYSENSVSVREYGTIDDVDIDLHINISFLDEEVSTAWKVLRTEPIVLRLRFSLSQYLDGPEPSIEVFQPSNKEGFGLGLQLKNYRHRWMDRQMELFKQKYNPGIRAILFTFPLVVFSKIDESCLYKQPHCLNSKNKIGPQRFWLSEQHHCLVDTYVDLVLTGEIRDLRYISVYGWEITTSVELEIARVAVYSHSWQQIPRPSRRRGTVGSRQLVPSRSSELASASSHLSPTHSLCKSQYLTGMYLEKSSGWAPHEPFHLLYHEEPQSGSVWLLSQPPGRSPVPPALGLPSPSTDLSFGMVSGHCKNIPTLEYGFLVQIMKYAEQRIPTLNEYCVVCDEQHVFQNGSMLKPAVCTRELCVFSFYTLGVMSGAAEEVATGAGVVDLLVAMCRAALESPRKSIIFEPYPSVVDPTDPKTLAFNPKKKNYERLQKALDSVMSIREMTQGSYLEIKKQMDKLDPLAHPLLQWIISSNRSHIVKLPLSRQLKFMHTSHQFLLLSSPPAKEARFRTAKKLYGSTFAFHGSHIENWHSILRNGLVNASYTKLQLHGAAYGKGIYLSPISSISFGYSGMGKGQHRMPSKDELVQRYNRMNTIPQTRSIQSRFLQSRNLNCIALCEVITSKDLQKHGNIWVCPVSDHVCTRFFFVYEDGQVGDANINTQDPKIQKEIMRVIGTQVYTN
uniref:Poly [ADP-ribose] polymerase n=1 Tax=Myotis lucifugus TaxID=59463 RepID=G1PBG5_MYOLU